LKRLDELLKARDGAASPDDTGDTSATDFFDVPQREGAGLPGCPACTGIGFVRRAVPFGHPDFGRAVPCLCVTSERDDEREQRLRRYANLGALNRLTFSTLLARGRSPEPAHQEQFARAVGDAVRFAESPEGFLVLLGESGTGKTHLAAAVANQLVEQGVPVFFTVVPDLMDHLRAAYSPTSEVPYDRLFETVRTAPVLVLDALGAQSGTSWADEKLFQVLNHRHTAQLPTVITSSIALEALDERIRTRLGDPELARVHLLEDGPGGRGALPDPLTLPLLRSMTFGAFSFKPAPPQITDATARNLQGVLLTARQFADHPEGWLVLLGGTGSGKTHLAAAIAHELQAKRRGVRFVVVPDLLDYLRRAMHDDDRDRRDLIEDVRAAPCLVLDDLGVHSATPWAQEKLYQILNFRYNAKLPTVITIAGSLDDLPRAWVSRMCDTKVGDIVEIAAPDFRGLNAPAANSSARPKPKNGRRYP
jgi:DNA replication protein DnaC